MSYVDFDVVKVRRLLLRTVDAEGGFLTTVLNDGTIFLANAEVSAGLQVVDLAGRICLLDFTLPLTQDLDAYFDVASAVCKPKDNRAMEGTSK